jgi:basic amino acid/polyamine antiporter, APA family
VSHEIRLRRLLGVAFGVAVAVGSMIGAGILRAPADVAARLPVPFLFLGVWVLGGAYALLGANAIAELGAMIPRSGGQQVFARRAFGSYAGFLVGWNDWLSTCASVAAVSIVFAEATRRLLPGAPGTSVLGTLLVAAITLVVWRGVRTGDRTQRVTSLAKALVLLGLIIACVVYAMRHDVDAGSVAARPHGLPLMAALVLALQGVIFAYDGWTGVIYFSEEVHEPGRDIPRALFGGVLSVLVLYLLINAAFLGVLSLSEMSTSTLPAADAATRVFGRWGGTVIDALVVIALPSAVVANLLMASRASFELGRDGQAPGWFTRVNSGGTPYSALAAGAIVGAIFLLTGTFNRVIAISSFLFVAGYTLSFAALFVLRRREPQTARPYRAWGHPWTTGIALTGSIIFLAGVIVADRRNGLIALALVLASWPVWRLFAKRAVG